MSTETKLLTGTLASVLTGILLMFHIGDPAQATTIAGYVTDIAGGLLAVIPPLMALDGLLFKHKAEISSQHLLDTSNTPTIDTPAPQTPVDGQPA